ncbi:ComF family protein [Desulfovibrio sp.]|uniref:ComF family protein n=1 Tax=Desulfovibrio sp. TaxID=885 RepID=UPI0026231FA3|nr:ComF family protein [Desulfovibrio sp.]
MTRFRRWLGLLGLDEIRCSICLRPFSPMAQESGAEAGLPVCPACRPHFAPYPGARCPQCGFPFQGLSAPDGEAPSAVCGACLAERPPWRAFVYHGLYKGALRELILRFKFGGDLALARLFGAWLEDAARCLPVPNALLAMPQHPAHLRRRGFNQAHELARALHFATALPLRPDLLVRTRDSAPQATLNAKMRATNVRGVFGASPAVEGMRLWLIDDVMTTGNTLKEATRTLLTAGACEVCVLAVARTPRGQA